MSFTHNKTKIWYCNFLISLCWFIRNIQNLLKTMNNFIWIWYTKFVENYEQFYLNMNIQNLLKIMSNFICIWYLITCTDNTIDTSAQYKRGLFREWTSKSLMSKCKQYWSSICLDWTWTCVKMKQFSLDRSLHIHYRLLNDLWAVFFYLKTSIWCYNCCRLHATQHFAFGKVKRILLLC